MTTIVRTPRTGAAFILMASLTVLVGCGDTGSIEGKVSYRPGGKNVVWGTVVITGRDNLARSGMIQSDGSYTVTGVPAGDASITVSSDNPKALMQPRAAPRGGRGAGPDEDRRPPEPNAAKGRGAAAIPDEVLKTWFPIPGKYADPSLSPLKMVVKPGKNQHDIVLE